MHRDRTDAHVVGEDHRSSKNWGHRLGNHQLIESERCSCTPQRLAGLHRCRPGWLALMDVDDVTRLSRSRRCSHCVERAVRSAVTARCSGIDVPDHCSKLDGDNRSIADAIRVGNGVGERVNEARKSGGRRIQECSGRGHRDVTTMSCRDAGRPGSQRSHASVIRKNRSIHDHRRSGGTASPDAVPGVPDAVREGLALRIRSHRQRVGG